MPSHVLSDFVVFVSLGVGTECLSIIYKNYGLQIVKIGAQTPYGIMLLVGRGLNTGDHNYLH